MKRLDIGAQAMGIGRGRRKVTDVFFGKGNDDRADFKTKNQQFPVEARLQQNFWVSYASRTSPNRPTHRMAEMVEPGKTVKRRECIPVSRNSCMNKSLFWTPPSEGFCQGGFSKPCKKLQSLWHVSMPFGIRRLYSNPPPVRSSSLPSPQFRELHLYIFPLSHAAALVQFSW